jgi:hypothetical protein
MFSLLNEKHQAGTPNRLPSLFPAPCVGTLPVIDMRYVIY